MNIYIGENIRRLRLQKQITQEQLAAAMGVTCAAVSKWERENTLPDITLLPSLAHYFNVSIDSLMGYRAARVEEEILGYLETRRSLRKKGKAAECRQLTEKAYRNYPNDHRVMNCYMWELVGDYADNDRETLLAHQKELEGICQRILEESRDLRLRLDAINMQGKLLHAKGKTAEAVALYRQEMPDWYFTAGQKTEQLFAKDTPEFAQRLRRNIWELGAFAANKKCKEIWYCNTLSVDEKGETALRICRALQSLGDTVELHEMDYYLWCFARDMAYKCKVGGGCPETVQRLETIAQEAKTRFVTYGKTDAIVGAYCNDIF